MLFVHLDSDPRAVRLTAAQEYRWATWNAVQKLAFPAGHRKLIAALHQTGMPGACVASAEKIPWSVTVAALSPGN